MQPLNGDKSRYNSLAELGEWKKKNFKKNGPGG